MARGTRHSIRSSEAATRVKRSEELSQRRKSNHLLEQYKLVVQEMGDSQAVTEEGLRRRFGGGSKESRNLTAVILIMLLSSAVIEVVEAAERVKSTKKSAGKKEEKLPQDKGECEINLQDLKSRVAAVVSPDFTESQKEAITKSLEDVDGQGRRIISTCLNLAAQRVSMFNRPSEPLIAPINDGRLGSFVAHRGF